MYCRPALELPSVRIPWIEKAQIVARPTQRRCEMSPAVHTMYWASRNFDSPWEASRAKAVVYSGKALREPDRAVALALGCEHHRVSTFCKHLDDAVEVA
jgi:hypothetical protein